MNLRRRSGSLWSRLVIALCLATSFSTQLAMAKRKQRKLLSPSVLRAKSVYLDVRLPVLGTPYYVKKRVQEWGRFRIVNDPKDADLVLMINSFGDPYGAMLTVMGGRNHKVYLTITTDGGSIPYRCVHLIDLFRERIKADEKSYHTAAHSTEKH